MRKLFTAASLLIVLAVPALAQELSNFNFGGRQQIVSPQINGEKVTFRLNANYATIVNLVGSWMENPYGEGIPMTKGQNGVWEITVETTSCAGFSTE